MQCFPLFTCDGRDIWAYAQLPEIGPGRPIITVLSLNTALLAFDESLEEAAYVQVAVTAEGLLAV